VPADMNVVAQSVSGFGRVSVEGQLTSEPATEALATVQGIGAEPGNQEHARSDISWLFQHRQNPARGGTGGTPARLRDSVAPVGAQGGTRAFSRKGPAGGGLVPPVAGGWRPANRPQKNCSTVGLTCA
jgi:hypothetical protein